MLHQYIVNNNLWCVNNIDMLCTVSEKGTSSDKSLRAFWKVFIGRLPIGDKGGILSVTSDRPWYVKFQTLGKLKTNLEIGLYPCFASPELTHRYSEISIVETTFVFLFWIECGPVWNVNLHLHCYKSFVLSWTLLLSPSIGNEKVNVHVV